MEHPAIQILLVTIPLFVTRVSPIYLEGEFTFLFLVLLNKMRMLGKPNVLFFFSGISQGNTQVGVSLEVVTGGVLQKSCSSKFYNIHKKASLLQPLSNKVAGF